MALTDEEREQRALRAFAAWGLFLGLFFVAQFAAEVNYAFGFLAYRALFIQAIGAPLAWIERHSGFQTFHAQFWGKVLYTVLVFAMMGGSLWNFAHSSRERKLVFGLLGMALAVVLVANVASKALHSYWLQTFSRDTLETLTSPFPIVFLIPVLILSRNTANRR